MRKKIVLIALFCIAMVFGCSAKITFVKFGQDAESDSGSTASADRRTPTGNKAINVLVLKADNSTLRTDTKQDANGELAAGLEGATAATDAIRDAVSNYTPDFSKQDSDNPITTTTTTQNQTSTATKPTTSTPGTEDDSDIDVPGSSSPVEGEVVVDDLGSGEKFSLSSGEGYKTLRTTKYGYEFGKSIRVVYPNGFAFTIPDTSKRFALNGRETVYRPGGPGLKPKTDERGTSHGGMGLWTKKAGSSSYVIIYTLQK